MAVAMAAAVLTVSAPATIPALTVHAAEVTSPSWSQNESEWNYKDTNGTDLTAKIYGNTLHIQGTGAIPSYSRDCLGNRPWHDKTIYEIVISDSVTEIGAEAFSNMKYVNSVTMPVSALVVDPSAFAGLHEGCSFYITGTNITSHNIGTIPYNSLDSIAAMMQKHNGRYYFKLANYYMTTLAQNQLFPKIDNLAPSDALSDDFNPKYPVIDYSSRISITGGATQNLQPNIACRQQGKAALEAFSIVIGDKQYVAAYNISVNNNKGAVKETAAPLQFSMTIPAAYRLPGRQFSLIQLGNGVINILDDEDMSDDTITFSTTKATAVYALVYKDNLVPTPLR